MLQSERLAAIGQMMTSLVHESRNALQRSEACLETLNLNLQGQAESLELVARVQKAQKKLYELFEEAVDRCEDAADVIHGVVLERM